MTKNGIRALFIASLICVFMVSVCLFSLYFIEINEEAELPNILCGICFWVFAIAAAVLQIILSANIKRLQKTGKLHNLRIKKKRVGIIAFFSNPHAVISDIALLASLVVFIVFMIIRPISIFVYISLSVLFLSFCTHCIFNGKNYYYIKNYGYIKTQITESEEN